MAAGWIVQMLNYSSTDFTIRTSDRTWRPVINGQQFAVDAPIALPRAIQPGDTLQLPFLPFPIPLPPGPRVLNVDFAMIGWTDFARTRIEGPGGAIEVMIGPTGPDNQDYLRIFDEQMNEIESIEIGPRGAGHVASVDFKLVITDESVRFLWWNSNFTGRDLLERFDKIMTLVGTELAKKLISGIKLPV